MNDYGYISAQRQHDNQIPKRYDDKPITTCNECGGEIYKGQEYYKGGCDICYDCYHSFDRCVAGEDEEEYY